MIAIAFTCGPVHPGLHPGAFSAVPSGLIAVDNPTQDYPDFLYAALDTSAYAAFFTESRTRSVTPTSFTGNPGPSWAILSRPYGTDMRAARELICNYCYPNQPSRKANLDKTASQPSLRD